MVDCTKINTNPETAESVTSDQINCLVTGGKTVGSLPEEATPTAVIKYGPPGSGKGSPIVTKQIEALGVPIDDYVVIEIDTIVEHVKNYRTRTVTLRNRKNRGNITKNNMYRNLASAYFNTRKAKNATSKSINDKLDNVLINAIQGHKDIIFETTGSRYNGAHPFKWLLDMLDQKGGYRIVVVYPLVDTETIQERVTARAERQYAESNETKRMFRAVDPASIPESVANSQRNFKEFVIPDFLEGRIRHIIGIRND
jgi:hypothetical protein